MDSNTHNIDIPNKLIPVWLDDNGELASADVRGSYGGRGSAKTRTFAMMSAVYGKMYGEAGLQGQILCARQYMNSLDDSSLEEVKRSIENDEMLKAYYEIGDRYIKSKDGRISYSFAGLDRNITSIKSKGRILLCWVDEAEPVTDYAWDVLIPTLREEGEGWNAELWVTWNPRSRVAPVEKRFRHTTDPRYRVVEMNWRDNSKFPEVLERARLRDLKQRPDEYEHIWEGAYGASYGAILAKGIDAAEREHRINEVVFDQDGLGVELSCDLGFRDTTVFWYWQRKQNGFSLLKCEYQSGWDAQDWIKRIQDVLSVMNMPLRMIWLPHDAMVKTFQSKHSSIEQFVEAFGADYIDIVPISKKEAQINAARTIIQRCEFNLAQCKDGIDGLTAWEFKYNDDTQAFSREPLHNWASHFGDSFAYGCQVMQEYEAEKADAAPRHHFIGTGDGNIKTEATVEELWDANSKRNWRI